MMAAWVKPVLTKIEGESAVDFWGIFDDLFSTGTVDPSQVEPADLADANWLKLAPAFQTQALWWKLQMEHVNHDDRIVDRYHAKMLLKLHNMLPVGWQAHMIGISGPEGPL